MGVGEGCTSTALEPNDVLKWYVLRVCQSRCMGVGESRVSTVLELKCFEVVCLEGLPEPLYGCRRELCLDRSGAQV